MTFDRATFDRTGGTFTIQTATCIVSTTPETVGSPGAIGFMPYWYKSCQPTVAPKFVTAPVFFEVDFPQLGVIYYKWIDVTYRFQAGTTDETRHEYIGFTGFVVS